MKIFQYILTGCSILMPVFLLAQSIDNNFEISGSVKDSVQPVAYANVLLTDSIGETASGVITDETGKFRLKAPKGNYTLTISFLGYSTFKQNLILEKDIDLGTLFLQPDDNLLNEVLITAEKPLIERKVDRLVFNVGQSIAATGGDAMDALKVTPRIKVKNDEISMIGKGNLVVMINDRIVKLSGEELTNYLKSLHTEAIDRIEVISNPPAKYSAEGNSGLINIVTKKTTANRWNATLRSSYKQATYAKGDFGGNFNFQKNKWELTAAADYIQGSDAPMESNQVHYPNLTWKEINHRKDYSSFLSARISADYEISDKLSTGLSYKYIHSQPLVKNNNISEIYNPATHSLDSIVKTPASDHYNRGIHSLDYHLLYKMDTLGRTIALDVDYFDFNLENSQRYHTQTFYPDNQPTAGSYGKARNFGIQEVQNYAVNLDMVHPTNWANLNYGGKLSYIKTNNSYEAYNFLNGEELLNPNLSNQFHYKENTRALYFSAQKKFAKQWEAKAGLRMENTQTEGYSKTMDQKNTNSYMKFFPTAYLSYTVNRNNAFSLNYGKRISRPDYQFLNPFVETFSPYSFVEGNPFLQPAFIDNIELEYSYKNKWINSLYYSFADDLYGQVTLLDAQTNIRHIISENYQKNTIVGWYQSLNMKPSKWWNLAASSNIAYHATKSTIPDLLKELKGWGASFDWSNDITLNAQKTLFFNLYFYYQFSGVSNLYRHTSSNQLDASIKWLLFDKKLTVSLYANDILSSSRTTYSTFTNGFKNSFRNYYDERYFRLSVSYNFGKSFKTKNRTGRNREEFERTQ